MILAPGVKPQGEDLDMPPDAYPDDLVQVVVLPDDTPLHIRPLRRCEHKAVRELFDRLSLRTRYLRFLSPLRSLPESLADALSCVDYRRTLALVAEREAPPGREVVGLGSFGAVDDHDVEVGLVVRDDWQKRRVGTELAGRIIAAAEARGYRRFIAHVTADNLPIRRILNRLGDVVSARSSGGVSELAFVARRREP